MGFRKLEGSKRSYAEQGLAYFTLANYRRLPARERKRIDEKIRRVCQRHTSMQSECYERALKRWLCDGWTMERCEIEMGVRAPTMRMLRVEIYDAW